MSGLARVTMPFAVALASAIGVASGWWLGGGGRSESATDEVSWLFSHTADSGEIRQRSDGSLELVVRGFDEQVTAFTDRPFRDAKILSVGWLVSSWNELFAGSPPNAVLVEHEPDGAARSVVVELSAPQMSGGELTYAITVLLSVPEGRLARVAGVSHENPVRAFEAVSLFIDDVSLSCAQGGECKVGDTGPGGGIVFYVASSNFASPGSDCGTTCRYLEAPPSDQSGGAPWCDNSSRFLGATSTGIGGGMGNTSIADATCMSGAIQIAADYSNNGKTDWYLPSLQELDLLFDVSNSVGGFSAGVYWTSSEGSATSAWFQFFSLGYRILNDKAFTYRVRPVRAF
jgi:hypothetical protein